MRFRSSTACSGGSLTLSMSARSRSARPASRGMFELMRGDKLRAQARRRTFTNSGELLREHDLPLFRALHIFLDGWSKRPAIQTCAAPDRTPCGRTERSVVRDGLLKIILAEAKAGPGRSGTWRRPRRRRSVGDGRNARATGRSKRNSIASAAKRCSSAITRTLPWPRRGVPVRHRRRKTAKSLRSFELARRSGAGEQYAIDHAPESRRTPYLRDPRLEGFLPTLEMPEIAEAQALLAVLAETKTRVRTADASRRRSKGHRNSQVAYGNVLILRRAAASTRWKRLKLSPKPASRRLGEKTRWIGWRPTMAFGGGSFIRGELSSMRAYAKDFLGDVDARPDLALRTGIADRIWGSTHHCAGEYAEEALHHLKRAL